MINTSRIINDLTEVHKHPKHFFLDLLKHDSKLFQNFDWPLSRKKIVVKMIALRIDNKQCSETRIKTLMMRAIVESQCLEYTDARRKGIVVILISISRQVQGEPISNANYSSAQTNGSLDSESEMQCF